MNRARQTAAQLFRCVGCERLVPWSFGCDDDMPEHCDDCWHAARPTASTLEEMTGDE